MKESIDYKDYQRLFNNIVCGGMWISTEDRAETVCINEFEEWKQCYSPYSKSRAEFPPFWFVNSKGDLISIQGGKARLLKKDFKRQKNNGNRYSYHYGNVNITAHALVGLCFDSLAYGRAQQLINDHGCSAFGINNNNCLDNVQGHHLNGNGSDNRPSNIEFLTARAHIVIHSKAATRMDYMCRFSKMAAAEEPNRATALLLGNEPTSEPNPFSATVPTKKIIALNTINFSDKAKEQLAELSERARIEQHKKIANKCIEWLINAKGLEYFATPRNIVAVCCNALLCFQSVRIAEDTVITNEIEYDRKTKNQTFIIFSPSLQFCR